MFRILSFLLIIGSFVWLYNFGKKNGFSISDLLNKFIELCKDSIKNISSLKKETFSGKIQVIKIFFYVFTTSLFLIMAISAFLPTIFLDGNLSGIFLLIHVSIAPFFAISLAISIVLFVHSNRFDKNDFTSQLDLNNNKPPKLNNDGYLKIIFWLINLFSLPAIISIILNMFPLFGTEGQNILLEVHRYSTLLLFILLILQSGILSLKFKNVFK